MKKKKRAKKAPKKKKAKKKVAKKPKKKGKKAAKKAKTSRRKKSAKAGAKKKAKKRAKKPAKKKAKAKAKKPAKKAAKPQAKKAPPVKVAASFGEIKREERPRPAFVEPLAATLGREADLGTNVNYFETEQEEIVMEEGPLAETLELGDEDEDFDDLGHH